MAGFQVDKTWNLKGVVYRTLKGTGAVQSGATQTKERRKGGYEVKKETAERGRKEGRRWNH